jgi:uncharacterized protein YggT (Ycf19 family)
MLMNIFLELTALIYLLLLTTIQTTIIFNLKSNLLEPQKVQLLFQMMKPLLHFFQHLI